jgi:hypothetical protein
MAILLDIVTRATENPIEVSYMIGYSSCKVFGGKNVDSKTIMTNSMTIKISRFMNVTI